MAVMKNFCGGGVGTKDKVKTVMCGGWIGGCNWIIESALGPIQLHITAARYGAVERQHL